MKTMNLKTTLIVENPNKIYAQTVPSSLLLSIKESGICSPLIVKLEETGINTVIDGHCRLQVAKDLQMESVPVIVKQYSSFEEEQLDMLNCNKSKHKSSRDLLNEAKAYRRIFPIEKGKRNDLLGIVKEEREISTNKIAERMQIHPKMLSRLETIEVVFPALLDKIDAPNNPLSIYSAYIFALYIRKNGLQGLEDRELMSRTIELTCPQFFDYIENGTVTWEDAFKEAVRSIKTLRRPTPNYKFEPSSELLDERTKNPTKKGFLKSRDKHAVAEADGSEVSNNGQESINSSVKQGEQCTNPTCKFFGKTIICVKGGVSHDAK